jgi:hypothetical protein
MPPIPKLDVRDADLEDFMDLFLKCAACGRNRGDHIDRKKCLFGPGEFKDVLGEGTAQVKALLTRLPK